MDVRRAAPAAAHRTRAGEAARGSHCRTAAQHAGRYPVDSMSAPLRIAVTLGDPRGIGPEVAAAAAREFRAAVPHSLLFIGPEGTAAEREADEWLPVGRWHDGDDVASAGRLAGLAVERAIEMALRGDVHAVVTAPLDKYALHAGGYAF